MSEKISLQIQNTFLPIFCHKICIYYYWMNDLSVISYILIQIPDFLLISVNRRSCQHHSYMHVVLKLQDIVIFDKFLILNLYLVFMSSGNVIFQIFIICKLSNTSVTFEWLVLMMLRSSVTFQLWWYGKPCITLFTFEW